MICKFIIIFYKKIYIFININLNIKLGITYKLIISKKKKKKIPRQYYFLSYLRTIFKLTNIISIDCFGSLYLNDMLYIMLCKN